MASFDENGKYIKTNWKAGDKITATKLNKIEESIEAVNDNDISRHVEADARLDALEAKDVAHDKELTKVKNLIADNKAEAELGDYEINSRMQFLEEELNEGIEEVYNVAETVDGKIAAAEANMTNVINTAKDEMTTQVNTAKDDMRTQVNTAQANMTAQVNQGKADMEAMVAEVEADLDGLHAKDEEFNEQLYCIAINVKDFGAKGDGVTDDTQAIQNAIDYANAGDKIFVPNGTFICHGIFINKVIQFECYGTLKVNGDIPCACVTVGDTSSSLNGFKGIFKLTKHGTNYSEDFIGLRVINSNSGVFEVSATNFTTQMEMIGHDAGCCYNAIHFNAMTNGKTGLRLTSVGTGWVNENKFYNGRFDWFAGNTGEDLVHIDIADADQNNNIFFSPSLEGSNGTFIKCAGRYNTFYSPRLEGNSTIANYTSTSYSNQILYPYFAENTDTDKIINEGKFNVFYGRYTTDMNRTSLINVGIEAFTNPNSNPDIDVPLRCGNAGSSSNTAFAVCNASKVDKMTVDGNGNIITSGTITSTGDMSAPAGKFKAKTPTTTALSVTNEDGSPTLSVKGSGSTICRINLNNNKSYLENFISNVSIITGSSTVPSGSPTNYAGTEILGNLVYNTTTNKLYIHVGGGVWKSIQFSD